MALEILLFRKLCYIVNETYVGPSWSTSDSSKNCYSLNTHYAEIQWQRQGLTVLRLSYFILSRENNIRNQTFDFIILLFLIFYMLCVCISTCNDLCNCRNKFSRSVVYLRTS